VGVGGAAIPDGVTLQPVGMAGTLGMSDWSDCTSDSRSDLSFSSPSIRILKVSSRSRSIYEVAWYIGGVPAWPEMGVPSATHCTCLNIGP